MRRLQQLALVGVIVTLAVWSPAAYSGLPESAMFSLHLIHLIDAGVVSYQPWTDYFGAVHPFREYGLANQVWNSSDIGDGYQVESYNFSNIPNVVDIQWDFNVKVAKVDNGQPVYEGIAPPYDRPVFPFYGTLFEGDIQNNQSFPTNWSGNTVNINTFGSNYTGKWLGWTNADAGMRSEISVNASQIIAQLPKATPVSVNFTAIWSFGAIISSSDAHLPEYPVGIKRAASVLMTIRNGTALSASGKFFVHTNDFAPVSITFRTIPVGTAFYATIGIVAVASTVLVAVFGSRVKQGLLRMVGRRRGDENGVGPEPLPNPQT